MEINQRRTVPGVFARTVKENPDHTALRYKDLGLWHDISFAGYHERARALGSALAAMGFQKGDKACTIGDNAVEWVVADLGIQCIGGVSVGIYATNAWQQVEYVVTHCDARFLFVENEEQLDKWLNFRDNTPLLKKVIVWDTRGLTRFSDPMVMTFDRFWKGENRQCGKNRSCLPEWGMRLPRMTRQC